MTLSCCGLEREGDGYSNRSGSLSSSQYWLSCCFVGVRHGRITELLSSRRAAMPSLSLYLNHIGDLLKLQPQQVCNADSVSGSNSSVYWVGSCYGVCIRQGSWAALRMCSTLFQPKPKNHTERRETRERERQKRETELRGEDSQELRGEVRGSTYICSHRPTNSRADTPDT